MKHGQLANALFPSGTRKTLTPTGHKKASMSPFGQHSFVLDHIVNSGGVLKIATELAQGYVVDRVATQAADLKVNDGMMASVMEGSQASFFALNKAPSEEHIARGAAAQDKWLINQSTGAHCQSQPAPFPPITGRRGSTQQGKSHRSRRDFHWAVHRIIDTGAEFGYIGVRSTRASRPATAQP